MTDGESLELLQRIRPEESVQVGSVPTCVLDVVPQETDSVMSK